MAESWEVYLSRINDQLSSICVDMSLGKNVPDPELPAIAWVFVAMNSPRPDGMVSGSESPRLVEIEDKLVECFEPVGGKLAGVVSGGGYRQYYFYLRNEDGFSDGVREVMQEFPAYRYEHGSQPDPEWNLYRDVLYPSNLQQHLTRNAKVIEILVEKGDRLETPRSVDHFAYFAQAADRDQFASWAKTQGFVAEHTDAKDLESDQPYGVHLTKEHPVDEQTVLSMTQFLDSHASEFNGTYDGWGTTVVQAPKSAPEGSSWLKKLFKK